MKDVVIALLIMLPFMFLIAWLWGYCLGYRDAKVEDRRDKVNCGSIGLGREISLGKLSVKKKGGVR